MAQYNKPLLASKTPIDGWKAAIFDIKLYLHFPSNVLFIILELVENVFLIIILVLPKPPRRVKD